MTVDGYERRNKKEALCNIKLIFNIQTYLLHTLFISTERTSAETDAQIRLPYIFRMAADAPAIAVMLVCLLFSG